ncbi:MAG: 50S ribosomal protein L23 [Clostridiales bacterium]|jgi:large subunit ribosomal protein L23|nr:50S ribosomal protein L23 [Clostridiales bacterium]
MTAHDIIIRPLLSEKSYDGIQQKRYTFIVHKKANKSMIKKAVEELFPDVKVESVRTANYDGKLKRQGRSEGLTPSYKKAVVQLREDSKPIAFFESLS